MDLEKGIQAILALSLEGMQHIHTLRHAKYDLI